MGGGMGFKERREIERNKKKDLCMKREIERS